MRRPPSCAASMLGAAPDPPPTSRPTASFPASLANKARPPAQRPPFLEALAANGPAGRAVTPRPFRGVPRVLFGLAAIPTRPLVGVLVTPIQGITARMAPLAPKAEAFQVEPVSLRDGQRSLGRVSARMAPPGRVEPLAAPPRPFSPRAPSQRLTGVGREVRAMDMAPHPIPRTRKTGLGPSVSRAYVAPREEEVAVPARNASDVPAAVLVLTLLEGRATHTRDAPDGASSDIGALGAPSDVPIFTKRPGAILLIAPRPQEARLGLLVGDGPLKPRAPRPNARGPRFAMVRKPAPSGCTLRAEP